MSFFSIVLVSVGSSLIFNSANDVILSFETWLNRRALNLKKKLNKILMILIQNCAIFNKQFIHSIKQLISFIKNNNQSATSSLFNCLAQTF